MQCEHKEINMEEKTFSNGSKHIEKRCKNCNKHLGYEPQHNIFEDSFEMPFGKHKGKTLSYVYRNFPDYLLWVSKEIKGNFGNKIAEFLKSKKDLYENSRSAK